jgi:hypothetical protein
MYHEYIDKILSGLDSLEQMTPARLSRGGVSALIREPGVFEKVQELRARGYSYDQIAPAFERDGTTPHIKTFQHAFLREERNRRTAANAPKPEGEAA